MNIEHLKKAHSITIQRVENGVTLQYCADVEDVYHTGTLVFAEDNLVEMLDLLDEWAGVE